MYFIHKFNLKYRHDMNHLFNSKLHIITIWSHLFPYKNLNHSLFRFHLVHRYCPSFEFCLVRQWGYYLQSPSHPPSALCCGRRSLMWCGAQAWLPERGRKRNGEETFLSSSVTSAPPADWSHCGPTSQPGESCVIFMHTSFPQLSRTWQHSEFNAGYVNSILYLDILNEAFFPNVVFSD